MKGKLALIIFLAIIRLSNQECIQKYNKIFSILKGNYQNTLKSSSGAIISSRKSNLFQPANYGSCLRDSIYSVTSGNGYIRCSLGFSINILLTQNYLLNTLKIWFWDRGNQYNQTERVYKITVYAEANEIEKIIYQNNVASSLVTIQFPEQIVQSFRILNVGGNTVNSELHIIKTQALYKINHKI